VWARFADPQQNGQSQSDKSQNREDPHPQGVSAWIVWPGMGEIVGVPDQKVQKEESDLLDEGH